MALHVPLRVIKHKHKHKHEWTQLTRIYWKWSPSKYCSTLEIIFVHYNKDFEIFFQELWIFITKDAILGFTFYRSIRFNQSPEPLILLKNLWEPINSTVWIIPNPKLFLIYHHYQISLKCLSFNIDILFN